MIKIVPDTNIRISSIFWSGKPYQIIRRGLEGEYQLIVSSQILDELINKLRNKFKFPEESIQEFVDILLVYCSVMDPITKLDLVRDKSDNKIIECAYDSKADYIVTGDPDLLEIKEYAGIKILNANNFLNIISKL